MRFRIQYVLNPYALNNQTDLNCIDRVESIHIGDRTILQNKLTLSIRCKDVIPTLASLVVCELSTLVYLKLVKACCIDSSTMSAYLVLRENWFRYTNIAFALKKDSSSILWYTIKKESIKDYHVDIEYQVDKATLSLILERVYGLCGDIGCLEYTVNNLKVSISCKDVFSSQ